MRFVKNFQTVQLGLKQAFQSFRCSKDISASVEIVAWCMKSNRGQLHLHDRWFIV